MKFSVAKAVPSVDIYAGEAAAPLALKRQFGMALQTCHLVLRDLGLLSMQQQKEVAQEARFQASPQAPSRGFNGR